jgi:hypothetical protein
VEQGDPEVGEDLLLEADGLGDGGLLLQGVRLLDSGQMTKTWWP